MNARLTDGNLRRLPASVRTGLALAVVAGLSALAVTSGSASARPASAARTGIAASTPTCALGNGISHVINIVFDNVHFARDNPNVPSDLEQMPHLLNFLKSNGTLLSNTHTPLIAHTADDSLVDLHRPVRRPSRPAADQQYKTYNPDGTTDPDDVLRLLDAPVIDTKVRPAVPDHDTTPSMVYSDHVPATIGDTGQATPAPWVPFTRAGCTSATSRPPTWCWRTPRSTSRPSSALARPRRQTAADPRPVQGRGDRRLHRRGRPLRPRRRICATRGREVRPDTPTPRPTPCPPSPAATPASRPSSAPGTSRRSSAAGTPNLIAPRLPGHRREREPRRPRRQRDRRSRSAGKPGFPGFSPTATQSSPMLADMQEAGIPVTYGYISDLHERKAGTRRLHHGHRDRAHGKPLGPGDACYVENAKAYDAAFATFFQRLAADGITPANTLFVISAEENDQFAGANVGRATEADARPTATASPCTPCSYAAGTARRAAGQHRRACSPRTASDSTTFDVEPQGASIYVHGQPAAGRPGGASARARHRGDDGRQPVQRVDNEKIVNYQAGAVEQRILHMQTADPLRTPTYTMFPKPRLLLLRRSGRPTTRRASTPRSPGTTATTARTSTSPGRRSPARASPRIGVDGPQPGAEQRGQRPELDAHRAGGEQGGTWVEEVDLRPTMLHLLGLRDDYPTDGRVITQML